MAKWEPYKGDYLGGVKKILEAYFNNAFGYPEVSLKLAGEEANLTRTGHPEAKQLVHQIVEAIKEVSEPVRQGRGFRDAWVYFSNVPEGAPPNSTALSPDAQQKLQAKINGILAQLTTTRAYAQEMAGAPAQVMYS